MEESDPKEIVRRGYDAISHAYREDAPADLGFYAGWIGRLCDALPDGAAVLDLGCGNGVPVSRDLAAAGHDVTGVDLSEVQIARARELVPSARFVQADATRVEFDPGSFDAVVSLYAIIQCRSTSNPTCCGGSPAGSDPAGCC